jgi:hypothetical protein
MASQPRTSMRSTRRSLLTIPLAAVMLAACGGSAASPSPEPSVPPEAKILLRVTTQQALPPSATFGSLPWVVITLEGKILSGGAVPAIFPGPLVMPVIERQLSAAGWAKVVAAARAAGLLNGARDFSGGGIAPGGISARLEIAADGKVYSLTGDPNRIMVCVTTPCVPEPGSPEAFGGFISQLQNPDSWLAADLGKQGIYEPAAYGLIVGPPPANDSGLDQPGMTWPIRAGFAGFGKPLADGSGRRCGTVSGADADAVRGVLTAANQLTKWQDPADGAIYGLTVAPVLPGDGDPCAGLV